MTQIIKIFWLKVEVIDKKALMMDHLEPYVILFCSRKDKWLKGMKRNDIAQEIRTHLYNNLDKFDNKKSSLRTWGHRVMINKWIHMYEYSNSGKHHNYPKNRKRPSKIL